MHASIRQLAEVLQRRYLRGIAGRERLARGVAIGVAIGFMPLPGLQMALALVLARNLDLAQAFAIGIAAVLFIGAISGLECPTAPLRTIV